MKAQWIPGIGVDRVDLLAKIPLEAPEMSMANLFKVKYGCLCNHDSVQVTECRNTLSSVMHYEVARFLRSRLGYWLPRSIFWFYAVIAVSSCSS